MKIGMKEEMGVADEMTSSVLGSRARSARICARSAQIHSFLWFWGEKWQQELSEGHENWHEVGDGRCQLNDIFSFGIACVHRAHLCAKRVNPLIFMVLGVKVVARIVRGS